MAMLTILMLSNEFEETFGKWRSTYSVLEMVHATNEEAIAVAAVDRKNCLNDSSAEIKNCDSGSGEDDDAGGAAKPEEICHAKEMFKWPQLSLASVVFEWPKMSSPRQLVMCLGISMLTHKCYCAETRHDPQSRTGTRVSLSPNSLLS